MRMSVRFEVLMICIGVDLGTQSLKVIVYDSKKHALSAKVSCPVSMIEKEGGVREQKAEWWLDAMRCCFSQIDSSLLAKADVISVSGQQHGFVPLSAEGHVLYNVKLWCDTSTVEECMEIEAAAGGRAGLSLRCGNPVLPGYTAGKIRWLYKHHRDLYDKISSVLLPHDYINWYLTGKTVMERGDASGTGLMNIFTGQWDEETVNACAAGLMEKLPEIQMTASIIGHVRPEAAAEFHLPESCLVACGGGDNMMSAIGTGCVKEGAVTISLGTSGTLFTFSEKPLYDKEGRFASFCSSTGGWLPLLCTMNCTVTSESVRKLFSMSHSEFDMCLSKTSPLSDGLVMLPFLNGERVPDLPHGNGVILGIRDWNFTRENILRCALEGVSYGFMLAFDALRENSVRVDIITLTGGGAGSPFWRQLIADMSGCVVRVPYENESAAFGALLQGLWCVQGGRIEDIVKEHVLFQPSKQAFPDDNKKDVYKKGYEKWLSYVNLFAPVFK